VAGHISYPRSAAIADAWSNYRHAVRLADSGALEAAIYKLQTIIDNLNTTEPLRQRAAVLLANLYFRLHPGLAIRADLPRHLRGPDGWNRQYLHGTHNLDEAVNALKRQYPSANITVRPTGISGIEELDYEFTDPGTSLTFRATKTVYNPSIFSDDTILELGQKAAEQAWRLYKMDPTQRIIVIRTNTVNFKVYINIDPQTGEPFVGNVHPVL
jgi:hypothetical protein